MKTLLTIVLIIVAIIVIRKSIRHARQVALRRQYAAQRAEEEREWLEAVSQADNYLEQLPIRSGEASITADWEAINSSFVYKESTYHDYIIGTKSETLAKLEEEMTTCWHMHLKRDPQVRGWREILKMFKTGKESCSYRWGENRDGVIVYRFGDDRYAFTKTHQDEVFS